MSRRICIFRHLLAIALVAGLACECEAKSYSSGGGRSYSSHSSSSHSSTSGGSRSSGGSHSSGSGQSRSSSGSSGSKSFNSGSKSYSSGSRANDSNRKGYSSSKSYTSGTGSGSGNNAGRPAAKETRRKDNSSNDRTFDSAAARARKEQASREQFSQFKQSHEIPTVNNAPRAGGATTQYPEPGREPVNGWGGGRRYVANEETIRTRPVRIYNVFNTYSSRPWVVYHDPYHSFFWWWLLDRSLDDRAWWAYHHRYDMDPLRYQALVANDQQLQARVSELEAQQVARDPNYVPPGIDRDLMYSDQYISRGYSNRPTVGGAVAFWVLGVPLALGVCAFFIWLIWFKRWQTASTAS